MSLQALVVAAGSSESAKVHLDDRTLVPVLGDSEDTIAVKLEELVGAISESVRQTITSESELTLEIAGSISLSGQAGGKWLFFNVGASASKSDTVKVVLKTTITPEKKES